MASVSWKTATSDSWTVASNWDTGNVPGTSDDAFLSVSGSYIVSLTASITVASLTIGDSSAVLQIRNPGGTDAVTGDLSNSGNLSVDTINPGGGSTLTVGGTLTNGNYIQVGNSGMTAASLLTVGGTFGNTGATLSLQGGQAGAAAQMVVTGAPQTTLTGTQSIVGNAGGASLQYGSGGITQIGDGASIGGDLYIDGANAFAKIGATNSNSALATLATIAGNGILELRDGATVVTATALTVDGGDGRLKIDAYGGSGGSNVTIGGNLTNGSFGNFSDGGVSVGSNQMTVADTLTVDGTFTDTGGLLNVIGGRTAGAAAQMVVTGQAPGTLTGNISIVGDTGGASLQYGSGAITQIGDGAANGAYLYIDGANAFAEIGATNSNSALDTLTTIAGNGVLDLRDGVTVATVTALTVDGGDGRLKIDAYGGSGGSSVTIGGDLTNGSFGNFSDGGVSVGSNQMTVADMLTVDGTFTDTGGSLNVIGGRTAGAAAQMVVTGAAPGTLTGNISIVGDAGGASLQYGSGAITQIGDGAANAAYLYIDGSNAFDEIGATSSNSALDTLTTIAGNGVLDLRDGVTVATVTALTVDGGDGRLKIDAYGGSGGSNLTIGGDLTNGSFGNFGDSGVQVGSNQMTVADTLTVDGTFTDTGGLLNVIGGRTAGASAQMLVIGALQSTLTGNISIVGDTGGASLQFGSGGVTQIGDGASNGGYLYIDGSNAFDEIGATNSNSALDTLTTIAGNGALDLRDGVTVVTTTALTVDAGDGRLKIDAYGGSGGSNVTIGGNLTNGSFGNFGDSGVQVGSNQMTVADTLTVDGTFTDTGGLLNVIGGRIAGASAQMLVTGALQSTLTGNISIAGGTGGASLQFGSGGITQIGDGAANGGDLYIDGANAFAEIGATNSNSALTGLTTIASNGLLDLRDGVTVVTTAALTVDGGDGRLKVDAYGGSGGSNVTIGGNLTNGSFGSFGDSGVQVGSNQMTVADTLTVDGTFTDTGGLLNVIGGRTADASAQMLVTGALQSTLTGNISTVGDTGGASLQFGSGGITQLGDGTANGAYLYIDGANAFDEIGATNSNSALTGLTTIAGNGVLELRDGAVVATTVALTVDGGDGRLKIDGYGGAGGSNVTIGGNLTNGSFGSFSDGGVSLGNNGMTVADTLTVNGTFTDTGGLLNVIGGQAGAAASMVVTGALQSTLTGNISIIGDAGGASLQYGSGGITQIGDGASNGGVLTINGANAFAEIGATNSNSALTGLTTIAGNGLLELHNGATVTIAQGLTVDGGDGILRIDTDGGNGGSSVTIGGNLTNGSFGSFSDGGVEVGTGGMTAGDTLTVNGTFNNTGGLINIDGGQTGAAARMVVTGAVASTLTGQYNIGSGAGGASLQWGSGGIIQLGDGASNGGIVFLDGATAFAEIGATHSNSALDTLTTIANNGELDLHDGATVTTAQGLTVQGGNGTLRIDSDGGSGGSKVTIGGDLVNASSGPFNEGGVEVGAVGMTVADTLTISGTLQNNAGAQFSINGNSNNAAGQAVVDANGPVSNAGGLSIGGNALLSLAPANAFTQTAGATDITGTLSASSIALTGGVIDLFGGTIQSGGLSIASGATLLGNGTVAAAITSSGSIEANGGTLDLAGGLATPAAIAIENASALELAGADSGNVAFAGPSSTFTLDQPMGFSGTLIGLAIGDTLILRNTKATVAGATFDSGTDTSTLAVTIAGGGTLDFTLAGNYAGDAFSVNQVGNDSQIAAAGAAVAVINTTLPVAFGTLRQGATATELLSITNNAPSGSAALDVSIGTLTGGATGSGTIVALAHGATDTTDISVGLNTNIGGVQTGTVTLDFASDLGGGSTAPLPPQSVTVTGTVYREAIAAITPLLLYAHVGDPGIETLDISNIATADGFSEALIAALTGATGGFTIASGGPTGDIVAGASDAATLQLSFSTAQTGIVSGDAIVSLTSDGGTGGGSIDGFGTIALPTQTLPISLDIDNFATAAIEGPVNFGTLTASGSATTLDLGTIAENTGPFDINFGVANVAAGPADLLSGSFVATAANGFALSGLGAFSGVGPGGVDTAGVTLDTTTGGVVTQTITLDPTGSNGSGFSAALAPQTLTITGTVEVLPPPTITAAATVAAMAGVPALIALSIGDPNTDTLPLTVTVTDTSGALTATTAGTATVSGSGSNTLTLTGNVTDINEELDTLAYAAAAVGTDTINVSVEDQHHASAAQSIAVDISPVPLTGPIVNGPTANVVVAGNTTALGGLSISDPYAAATGQQLSVTVTAQPGTMLNETGTSGAVVTGAGTNSITLTGNLAQINADLADPLTSFAVALTYVTAAAVLNAISIIVTGSPVTWTDTQTVAEIAEQIQIRLEILYPYLRAAGAAEASIPAIEAASTEIAVIGEGDAHIATFSGQLYDFNATGEFVLARSTQSGNAFDVQIRLQPLSDNSSATVITQAGAEVGSDRVTFGTGRAATVWVDGAAINPTLQTPVTLSGGHLTQISADSYQITWNTGENLIVVDHGSYLDVKLGLGVGDGPGSVQGLAGTDSGAANDFTLPNGTVLTQPVSAQLLYTTFANAWRLTQGISLLDYGTSQTTATFTPSTQVIPVTLADLPAAAVAAAAQLVQAAGITNPQAVAAAEYDYLATGNPDFVGSASGILSNATLAAAPVTQSTTVASVLGVYATQPGVVVNATGTTAVVFGVYLTSPLGTDTVVDYDVISTGTLDLQSLAFGGVLPSGEVTIGAGQTTAMFTIDLPQGALGGAGTANLQVAIADPSGPPVFSSTALAAIASAQPGPPPDPEITEITTFGDFSRINATTYNLDLGPIVFGETVPTIQFAISNKGAVGSDQLGGNLSFATVAGYTVSGATAVGPLSVNQTYAGLSLTVDQNKFGANEETITFTPTDINPDGSQTLTPITLNVTDTLETPTTAFSEAWGDVHIITYSGLRYDFQAVGEFVLAHSNLPGDSYDIQLRLQQYGPGSLVSVITQTAVSLGTDRVTFDTTRADFVEVNGTVTALSPTTPKLVLNGGTLTELSPTTYSVQWNTGESATITDGGRYENVTDSFPESETGHISGIQGENQGQSNDFQLPDGTVLQQPLTSNEFYNEYANAWRVSQATSLFDYLPGQTTATFTDLNFPSDVVPLSSLPSNLVANAAQMVAAAGITDPGIAASAEYDYLATGDPSFITAAAAVQHAGFATTPATITPSATPQAALGVTAAATQLTEAASGTTTVTFQAYLTGTESTDTTVNYAVIAPDASDIGASAFGGTLPSGQTIIAAGSQSVQFTITLPDNVLGSTPSGNIEVQITTTAGNPLLASTATTEIVNSQAEAGTSPAPAILALSQTGTLTNQGDAYLLNLGTVAQGAALPTLQFAIANEATSGSDSLGGTFHFPTGSGFLVTGDNLSAPIAAGAQYDGLYVAADTSQIGQNSETLVFNGADVNGSGFDAALAPITLVVTDTIVTAGVGQLNTPQQIVFPNVHVGSPESQPLSVSNTGGAPIGVSVAATNPITAQGTIATLAPGAMDTSDLSVSVDTSTAGAKVGAVDVNFGATDPPVDVFGDVYRLASGTIAPVTDFVHVNDPGTIAVAVSNGDPSDGFSEALLASLASVTGTGLSIAAPGPTGDIVPGSSDTSSLRLGFSTAQVGTIAGTATVDLTSDGGTGTGSIDGLGTTALTPQVVPVAIAVNNFANPVFEEVSNTGTFTNSGTAYALNLGTISQDSGSFAVDLGVLNNVAGPADLASGSLSASGASAFTANGLAAFSGLAAGQADIAPMVTLATDTAGIFTETITLAATGSNPSGYSAALPAETLTVTGTVAPTLFTPAIANVLPASPINFGAVHVGTTAQRALDISNTATVGSASLDATVQSTTGDATASGSFTSLAPSAPASTAINVGINTGTAGTKNGSVALAFVSDAGTLGSAGLPTQNIAVGGTVYREAAALVLPITETVHVGDLLPFSSAFSVSNTDPNDGFSESLIATLLSTSGDIYVGSAGNPLGTRDGPTGDIVAGGTNDTALAIGFSTASAGTITGTGTIGLTSDGGTGAGSIDGLGQTALPDQTVSVTAVVDNYANAELTSHGNLTSNGVGSNAFTLNLGTATQGAGALTADLNVLNNVAGPADWLNGTYTVSGGGQFVNSGFATFGTLSAGGSLSAGSVSLQTNQLGVFNESIVLAPTDTNADGFSKIQTAQTVTVTGTIVPTGTAQGDVHMVTYDGLHYDFQADGAFMLSRSTVPGDTFQIQVQTAADPTNGAASYAVVEAAQVGSDVVTFAIDRTATVWVDGAPDTSLNAADPVQTLDGGLLRQLSPTSFQLTWATGQSLGITDQGAYLDSSVGLGAANGPGSVQGLLGSDSGQANDFQLPDGSVLPQPLSASELYGTFADAWSVTPADSLLGAPGGTNAAAAPVGIGATEAGPMQFIYPDGSGQTVVLATAADQILHAGPDGGVLSDAGGFGVTFQGTLSELAEAQISGASVKDLIDVTDLNSATVSDSYSGSGGSGVLYLTDGAQTGQLALSGQLAGGSFHLSPDAHGGTQIAFG